MELRENTSVTVRIGPFLDQVDGTTVETGVTLGTAQQAELLKHTGTTVDISGNTFAAITGCDGWYDLTLGTADTNERGQLVVAVQNSTLHLPVLAKMMVVGSGYYDAKYGTAYLSVNLIADQSAATVGTVNYVGTTGTLNTNKDKTGYTAQTVSDKTGYSLAADQSAVTIGTANFAGTAGTLLNNADKSSYNLAADQSAVSIGTAVNVGTVGTLGAQAKTDVNGEVVDVIRTDTISELSSVPGATPALSQAVMLVYMALRNTLTTTGSLLTVYNDAGAALGTKALTDDGTTYTEKRLT